MELHFQVTVAESSHKRGNLEDQADQSRSQSPRYPRPAVWNSCDRSNCAGVRYSHIRIYQMASLFHEAIEFSMEKLGIKVSTKEQYDA